jgi:hypothetical protein
VCESLCKALAEALADYEARGGRKQDYNQMKRDAVSWFRAVPGLINEIALLAWAHRGESPLILTTATSQSDADGSDIRVEMIPRSFWDEDPRFLETYSDLFCEQLRHKFGEASFGSSNTYLYYLTTIYPDNRPIVSFFSSGNFSDKVIRGVEIAVVLTTATKAEDLADAFAWFEDVYGVPLRSISSGVAAHSEPSIISAWRQQHHAVRLGT